MDTKEIEAVCRCTVDRITLSTDNDEDMYGPLNEGAREAVWEMCNGDRDMYAAALQDDEKRLLYIDAVGERVAGKISEWLVDHVGWEALRIMLDDVLDLGDGRVQRALGGHYLPEAGEL